MHFIDKVLHQPSYGWENEKGELIKPSLKQLYAEAFSRVNIFADKKNWITFISWLMVICMLPLFFVFIFWYFSIQLFAAFIIYSVIIMGTHSTIWYHRFCTHKAYTFSHPLWRFIIQNLVIKTFPEELYVISHHVHHIKSDLPGDPYNSRAGLMYCMLADVNHQSIAKDLSTTDYYKASNFLRHTGLVINSYNQYNKWGCVTYPFYTVALWLVNWSFWYYIFFLLGGNGLACDMFAAAMVWMILVRAFNYTSHGKGQIKHIDGIDFDRKNLSLNQMRPGLFCGEWHNNHHLYPASARAGFLPYQIDVAWVFIFIMYKIGIVSSYHDSKKQFLQKYKMEEDRINAVLIK